ncbi:MAG TPA: tyrosine-type recombinase/integrase [Roseococcus sp.]|jgi:integrase|nr:tyrosine-type recombinase/integrase [Roseococcus sp.]
MPSPRKSAKPGKPRIVRKVLADGTVREYAYPPRRKAKARPAPSDTLEALIRAFEGSPEYAAKAASTRQNYAIYLKPWAKVGHLRARDIRRTHVLTIRDAIAASRGPGAATAFVRTTGALFSWAIDREWVEVNPAARIKALPGGHHRPWSDAEAAQAGDGLPEHLRRVALLAGAIGQRRGDLCRLTWAAYDGQAIRLTQQKTGEKLVLTLPPDLCAELDGWKRQATAITILTNARGQPWTAPHLSREIKRATEALGLHGLKLHGLRRRVAVRIANAGGTMHEIASVTGHRSLSMVQEYTRGADQERLAAGALERIKAPTVQTKRKG